MIKAIGFDYGGVIEVVPGVLPGEFASKVSHILKISKEEYHRVYYRHNRKINLGEINWEEFWKVILQELNKLKHLPELLAFLEDRHTRKIIDQKILLLAKNLRSHGLKTGILSNNSKEKADKIRAEGLGNFFDVIHVSAETGFVKPEPGAFRHFAEALNVNLDQLIFIDDSEKSLESARELEYTPILFENFEHLREDLRKLTLLPL